MVNGDFNQKSPKEINVHWVLKPKFDIMWKKSYLAKFFSESLGKQSINSG
jgi:hypothetical protein